MEKSAEKNEDVWMLSTRFFFFLRFIYRLIFGLNIENVRILDVWIIHIGISVHTSG